MRWPALVLILGLSLATVWWQPWPQGRHLRAADGDPSPGLLGPCLAEQFQATWKSVFGWCSHFASNHWAMLSVACVLLGVSLVCKKRWQDKNVAYELLRDCSDEETLGDASSFKMRTDLLYTMALWLGDMISDMYVIYTYFIQGMYVFGAVMISIWVTSGCLAFFHRRQNWKRCDPSLNIHYYCAGLNAQGEPIPGCRSFLLYTLQIQPLFVAVDAWKSGKTTEWQEENALTALCEGAPSSLLQLYALLLHNPKGNPALLSLSIGLSILTVAEGINKSYSLCKPEDRPMEGCLPKVFLSAVRWCEVFSRVSLWALVGLCLEPRDAKQHGIQQPYLPFIVAADCFIVALLFKSQMVGLGLTWSEVMKKRYFMGLVNSFLGNFLCCYKTDLISQRRFGRILLFVRACETVSAFYFVSLAYSHRSAGECFLAHKPAAVIIFFLASFTYTLTFLLAIANDVAMSLFAFPLFPVVDGWAGGRLELAARLGLASQIGHLLHEVESDDPIVAAALCQAAEAGHVAVIYEFVVQNDVSASASWQGDYPIHAAARGGHVAAMKALRALVPDSLDMANGEGHTPAHSAAVEGHVEVLKFLQASGCPLDKAAGNGGTLADFAAMHGHVEVLKFLQASGCVLDKADSKGNTPANFAASNGHVEVLEFLRASGCSLDKGDSKGNSPAHFVASNGRLEVLKFLHASGCAMDKANNKGNTPANFAASNGHVEVLEFLQASGCSLDKGDSKGNLSSHFAANNGHVEVLKFLQVSGCPLDKANGKGDTPVHLAARHGHIEVLRFLQASGCALDKLDGNGDTPANLATRYEHVEILEFLQLSGCSLDRGDSDGGMLSTSKQGPAG